MNKGSTHQTLRFKLYKDGKKWVVAGIGVVAFGLVATTTPVHASVINDSATTMVTGASAGTAAVEDTSQADAETAATSGQTTTKETGDTADDTPVASSPAPVSEETAPAEVPQGTKETDTKAQTEKTGIVSEDADESPADDLAQTPKTKPTGETAAPADTAADTAQNVADSIAETTHAALSVTAEQSDVDTNTSATFDLGLVVAGINGQTDSQSLTVTIPTGLTLDEATLKSYAIDNTIPVDDGATGQLTYAFDKTFNGISTVKKYVFSTDASMPNGTVISVGATYVNGETVINAGEPATVTVHSSAKYGTTNQFVAVLQTNADGSVTNEAGAVTFDTSKAAPVAGDYVVYQFGVSAPKKVVGQAYFKPGSQIVIWYTLPAQMTYVGTLGNTGQPPIVTQSDGVTYLYFTLAAPTLAEQDAATDNLIDNQFYVVTKLADDVAANTRLVTADMAQGTTINGDAWQSAHANSTVYTAADLASQVVPTEGTTYWLYNFSPKINDVNIGSSSATNIDPQVLPGDTITSTMILGTGIYDYTDAYVATMQKYSPEYRALTDYEFTYDADQNDLLDLQAFYVAKPTQYAQGGAVTGALQELPTFDVYVQYEGASDFETTPILTDVSDGMYSLDTLTDTTQYVDKLKFVWTKLVGGMLYGNLSFYSIPKPNVSGTSINDWSATIGGVASQSQLVNHFVRTTFTPDGATVVASLNDNFQADVGVDVVAESSHGTGEPLNQATYDVYMAYMSRKTLEIVQPSENTQRVFNESLKFTNTVDGRTALGDNSLKVVVENNTASLMSISGVDSYVVLPKGITYTGSDTQVTVADADYLGTGATLLHIDWVKKDLAPKQQNSLLLPVTLASGLTQFDVQLYSYTTDADALAPGDVSETTASDVVKMTDTTDVDNNTATTDVFFTTYSSATTKTDSLIGVQATAENKAGTVTTDDTLTVSVARGDQVTFGLQLRPTTDTALQDVVIIGTLPSVDDTAVLNTEDDRGTTAIVQLTGPVVLPASWENLAQVLYTTSTTPADSNVAWLSAESIGGDTGISFNDLTAFKIVFTSPISYLDGGAQQITIPAWVTMTSQAGQTAYISFSMTANGLATTEGTKAGLVVVDGVQQLVTPVPATLTIHYVDENGNTIGDVLTKTGYVGNGYQVTPGTIDGYTYVGIATDSAPVDGVLTTPSTTVTLQYQAIRNPNGGGNGGVPTAPSQPTEQPQTVTDPETPVVSTVNTVSTGGSDDVSVTSQATTDTDRTNTNAHGNTQTAETGQIDLETPAAVTSGGARQSAQTPQNGAKALPQTDEQNGATVKALGLVGLMTLLLGMLPWKKQE